MNKALARLGLLLLALAATGACKKNDAASATTATPCDRLKADFDSWKPETARAQLFDVGKAEGATLAGTSDADQLAARSAEENLLLLVQGDEEGRFIGVNAERPKQFIDAFRLVDFRAMLPECHLALLKHPGRGTWVYELRDGANGAIEARPLTKEQEDALEKLSGQFPDRADKPKFNDALRQASAAWKFDGPPEIVLEPRGDSEWRVHATLAFKDNFPDYGVAGKDAADIDVRLPVTYAIVVGSDAAKLDAIPAITETAKKRYDREWLP